MEFRGRWSRVVAECLGSLARTLASHFDGKRPIRRTATFASRFRRTFPQSGNNSRRASRGTRPRRRLLDFTIAFRHFDGSQDAIRLPLGPDGITEARITRLTNLEGLSVVSYSRVRRFKGSLDEAAEIGRQLGVEAVIEGTVRLASGRLRMTVHGVDTKSGYTIWAIDRFEAKPEGLLDIEGQLTEAAAHRVRGQLTARERDLVTKSRATNAEAYDLVLRARREDPATAVQMLHRAVQLDPGFADAYGWLALAQLRTYNLRLAGPETLRKAISNANQALSKDPNAPIAIRALAHIHHATGREVEGLLMARRDLESSPDDLDAIAAAAEAYFRNGLYDRAIPLYEKALAGEPTSVEFRSQLARMYLFLGEYKNGIEVISPLPLSQAGLFGMLLYAETGQMAKAVEMARGERPAFLHHNIVIGEHPSAKTICSGVSLGMEIGKRGVQSSNAMGET